MPLFPAEHFQQIIKIFYLWLSLKTWQRKILINHLNRKKQRRSWRGITKLIHILQKQAFGIPLQKEDSSLANPFELLLIHFKLNASRLARTVAANPLHCGKWKFNTQWFKHSLVVEQWLGSLHYHQDNLRRRIRKEDYIGLQIKSEFYHRLSSMLPKYILFIYFSPSLYECMVL